MANHFGNGNMGASLVKIGLREGYRTASLGLRLRLWWNWQTRYFEVVVGQPVQVQVLLSAPSLPHLIFKVCFILLRNDFFFNFSGPFPGRYSIGPLHSGQSLSFLPPARCSSCTQAAQYSRLHLVQRDVAGISK